MSDLRTVADFAVVIPARYASTRLPGKPLLEIEGAPMVVHVARRARQAGARTVVVATDHDGIAETVSRHGFEAAMTAADHASGTDRIAEVARARGWGAHEIVVNVQGDEPLIDPNLVARVAETLAGAGDAAMATACCALEPAELANPNVVKAVLDRNGYALYFSRAPIPYPRDAFRGRDLVLPADYAAYRHIGLYAYRCGFLQTYSALEPAPMERFEALEQLRALWHGFRIAVTVSAQAPVAGVDTEEDLIRVRAHLAGAG